VTALLLGATLLVLAASTLFNGFHDASNSVAAAVRTRALTPRIALVVVAAFTTLGGLVTTGLSVALVQSFDPSVPHGDAGLVVVLLGLLAAGGWNVFTWWKGLPSSSTHATIAGVAGASLASAVVSHRSVPDALMLLTRQVALPLVITTVVAFGLSYVAAAVVIFAARNAAPKTAAGVGGGAQSIGACAVSLAHGMQDGQRALALAVLTLATAGVRLPDAGQDWLQVAAAVLLGLGVFGGGWRITYTLSTRLVTLDPLRAGTANAVSSVLLFIGAFVLRLPISSTQAVTAGLVGAGTYHRYVSVSWAAAVRIAVYWVLTPVVCAVVAGILSLAVSPLL
jgi:PiT family inorganic phosphate transporter